jgi:hypothetical protein
LPVNYMVSPRKDVHQPTWLNWPTYDEAKGHAIALQSKEKRKHAVLNVNKDDVEAGKAKKIS